MYDKKNGINTKVLYAIFPEIPEKIISNCKKKSVRETAIKLLEYFLQFFAPLSKSYYKIKQAYAKEYSEERGKLEQLKKDAQTKSEKNQYDDYLYWLELDYTCNLQELKKDALQKEREIKYRLSEVKLDDEIEEIVDNSLYQVGKFKRSKLFGKHIICASIKEAKQILFGARLQRSFNNDKQFILREGHAAIIKFNLYKNHYFKLQREDICEFKIYSFNKLTITEKRPKSFVDIPTSYLQVGFTKENVCTEFIKNRFPKPIFIYVKDDFYRRHTQLVLMVKLIQFVNKVKRNICIDVLVEILSYLLEFDLELNDGKQKTKPEIRQKKVRSRAEVRFIVGQLKLNRKKINKFFQSPWRSKLIVRHKDEKDGSCLEVLSYFAVKSKKPIFFKKLIRPFKPCFSCGIL